MASGPRSPVDGPRCRTARGGRVARPAGGPGRRAVRPPEKRKEPWSAAPETPQIPDPSMIAPGGAVVKLSDARRRRAAALLRDEDIPDQEAEARLWGDAPRGTA